MRTDAPGDSILRANTLRLNEHDQVVGEGGVLVEGIGLSLVLLRMEKGVDEVIDESAWSSRWWRILPASATAGFDATERHAASRRD